MSTTEEIRKGFYLGKEGEWIPDGWDSIKLGDISTVDNGGTPSTKNITYWSNEIPWITPRDLTGYRKRFISKGGRSISQIGLENSSAKLLPKNTILFSSRAPIGYTAIAQKELTTNQGFKNIICCEKSAYFKYIYYLMKYSASRIEKLSSGSTFSEASASLIKSFQIILPPLAEQKSIAAVLGSLDDKIELLRDQNETLETLAQTLFKRWFIDFNFPDKNGNPYKDNGGKMTPSELGEIPEGWLEIELGEIVSVKRGGSPRPIKDFITTGDGLRWLKISDASATDSPFIHQIKEKIIKEGLRKTTHLEKGKLVLSNSATPGIPKFLAVDSCIHDGWLHFPNIGHLTQEYLYLLFLKIRPELIQQGNGSVFTNLKTDILKQHIVTIPQKNNVNIYLLKSFSHFFDKIESNTQQIQTLTNLRNTLLPKLMKGEIRLK